MSHLLATSHSTLAAARARVESGLDAISIPHHGRGFELHRVEYEALTDIVLQERRSLRLAQSAAISRRRRTGRRWMGNASKTRKEDQRRWRVSF